MRHTCLCEFIEVLNPIELVCALHFIHQRAEQGISSARIVMQEFCTGTFCSTIDADRAIDGSISDRERKKIGTILPIFSSIPIPKNPIRLTSFYG